MDNKEKTICFTGHRDIKDIEIVKKQLLTILKKYIKKGYYSFIAGGALGFDTIAAIAICNLKEKYPQIKLILVLPFQNAYEYEKGWSNEEIEIYDFLKNNADEVIALNTAYKRGCYYERNRYMVDNSDVCIAYQKRKSGGTAYTVDYATSNNLDVVNIATLNVKI